MLLKKAFEGTRTSALNTFLTPGLGDKVDDYVTELGDRLIHCRIPHLSCKRDKKQLSPIGERRPYVDVTLNLVSIHIHARAAGDFLYCSYVVHFLGKISIWRVLFLPASLVVNLPALVMGRVTWRELISLPPDEFDENDIAELQSVVHHTMIATLQDTASAAGVEEATPMTLALPNPRTGLREALGQLLRG